jgi:DNA-binding ferritin-like protein
MFDIFAAAWNMYKDADDDYLETIVRKAIGEAYYKGLLTHLTGSEIGSRIGFNGLLYRAPRFAQWSDDPIKAAVESLGGPAFGVAQRIFDGAKKVSEGEVERGIEQMLPTFFSNFLKANRYDSEGFKTLRGDEVSKQANGYEVAMQMIGFAPQSYMEQIQQNTALKAKDKYVTTEKTRLLRQLYVAYREGDQREADEVMEKLRKLGEKHPGTVTADTIISSLKANAKTSAEMFHGITLSKAMRAELMEDASEYSFSDDELED